MRSEAKKKAQLKYRRKLKKIQIVFSLQEEELFNNMRKRASEEGTIAPTWVKNLIKRELDGHE